MKTITIKIVKCDYLLDLQKKYSSIVRFAYNRFKDGLKEKEVRSKSNEIFKSLGSWFIQCAIKEASQIYSRHKNKKVIFGGRSNFIRYVKGLITKEEYRSNRLHSIVIQGEKLQSGNRSFNFNFDENFIIYKFSRNEHYRIEFSKPKKNWLNQLQLIKELADQNLAAITVKLDFARNTISFIFDESLIAHCKYKSLKDNRILGIDLNPNYIGLSVLEFCDKDSEKFKVLHKEVFSLVKLTNKNISKNKRHFELIEICHRISRYIDYWKCSKLAIEDLNIKSSDKGLGRNFNRLCNNVWNRNLVVNKLKMLGSVHEFSVIEVNPAYSSFIGNMLYGNEFTPDMIASSIEIARRAYNKYLKGHFYPVFSIEAIDERWKQTLSGIRDWKSAFRKVKESGLKYRFLLQDYIKNAAFSKNHITAKLAIYEFN